MVTHRSLSFPLYQTTSLGCVRSQDRIKKEHIQNGKCCLCSFFFRFYRSAIFHRQISSPISLAQRCTKTRHGDSASVVTTYYTQVELAHKPQHPRGSSEIQFSLSNKKKKIRNS